MHGNEIEDFAALAQNWRDAEELRDSAASEAFENELHARITVSEISKLQAPDADHPLAIETDQLRSALGEMWNNASARLD